MKFDAKLTLPFCEDFVVLSVRCIEQEGQIYKRIIQHNNTITNGAGKQRQPRQIQTCTTVTP